MILPLKNSSAINTAVKILKSGGVGVLPTDTIYGIVGSALNKKTVARIYRLKKRQSAKPFIILISSSTDLKKFSVSLNPFSEKVLEKIWPGKTSVVLPCAGGKFKYLHRGVKSLAFRMPKNKVLTTILKKIGPLVAPSANIEGCPESVTIPQAQKYFRDKVDFYLDGGKKISKPSTLIKIENAKVQVLRRGAGSFKF